MDILYICLEIIILAFILFYAYHLYYYIGLRQGRKKGISTRAKVLEYGGKSTAWAEQQKTFFELFYRKKRFHKYLVEYTDVQVDVPVRGNLVVADKNLTEGNMIEIKYVVGKRGKQYIVPEECYKWFFTKFWIYTLLILCLFVICICKEYGIF